MNKRILVPGALALALAISAIGLTQVQGGPTAPITPETLTDASPAAELITLLTRSPVGLQTLPPSLRQATPEFDPAQLRLAHDEPSERVYVGPGRRAEVICLVMVDQVSIRETCNSARVLRTFGAMPLLARRGDGSTTFAAIVADGYQSARAATTTAAIRNNVVVLTLPGEASRVIITGPAGSKVLNVAGLRD